MVVLLEAEVDVEVEGVPIVLLEECPCVVVLNSEDVSDVVMLLEPTVVVEAVVDGFEVVDDVVGVVSVDNVVPSDAVVVLLEAAVVVVWVVLESVVPPPGATVGEVVVPVVI